jgi:hypothetical protein
MMIRIDIEKDFYTTNYQKMGCASKVETPTDWFLRFKLVSSDPTSTSFVTHYNWSKLDISSIDLLFDPHKKYDAPSRVNYWAKNDNLIKTDIIDENQNIIPANYTICVPTDDDEAPWETNIRFELNSPYDLKKQYKGNAIFITAAAIDLKGGINNPFNQCIVKSMSYKMPCVYDQGKFTYSENGKPEEFNNDDICIKFNQETEGMLSASIERELKLENLEDTRQEITMLPTNARTLFAIGVIARKDFENELQFNLI